MCYNKRIEEIKGKLSYNLEKGCRAFIQIMNGEALMTSQVVDIRNKTTDVHKKHGKINIL